MTDRKYYVTFDEETGRVIGCTNVEDATRPQVEVEKQVMVDFVTGEKTMHDYIVVPTPGKNKGWEITFKHKDFNDFDVDKSIHRIPCVSVVDNPDSFIFKQDTKNGKWFVKLTGELRTMLSSSLYYKDKTHQAFVTKKDDPNILLDTISVQIYNILAEDEYELKDINSKVASDPDVSLYCGKVFENYFHLVEK